MCRLSNQKKNTALSNQYMQHSPKGAMRWWRSAPPSAAAVFDLRVCTAWYCFFHFKLKVFGKKRDPLLYYRDRVHIQGQRKRISTDAQSKCQWLYQSFPCRKAFCGVSVRHVLYSIYKVESEWHRCKSRAVSRTIRKWRQSWWRDESILSRACWRKRWGQKRRTDQFE